MMRHHFRRALAHPLAPALLGFAVITLATRVHAQRAPAAPPIAVQMGARILPETVTVGDPFVVTVRVRVPRGAVVAFADGPDSAAAVELIDPRRLAASADSTEFVASWRLAAWDVGTVPLGLPAVTVRQGGAERLVPLEDLVVTVRSVLPADSAKRVPRAARPPVEIARSLWWAWLLAALAVLLIAWLVWRWLRRRRDDAPMTVLDPYAFAEQEFERVERLGLVEAGERGRYVALVVDVLRDYLARRVDDARASLTATELLARMSGDRRVPVGRLAPLLAEADLVKFARRPVSAERARAMGTEARALVREVNAAHARADAASAALPALPAATGHGRAA